MTADGSELRVNVYGGDIGRLMQDFPWTTQRLIKERFGRVIDHLEVPRIENDARRVAIFENHLLGIVERHRLRPPDSVR